MVAAAYPPGIKGIPYVGPAFRFRRDPLAFLEQMASHGPVTHTRFGGRDCYLASDPEVIQHVLARNHRNYHKSEFNRRFRDLLGEGLLTAEDSYWKKQRKLMAPAFHGRRIAVYATVMQDRTEAAIADWKPGETRDVAHEMMELTLDIAVRCLFGTTSDRSAEVGRAFTDVASYFAVQMSRPFRLPSWVPTPGNLAYRRGVETLHSVVADIIATRRAQPGGDDLLSMLLELRDEDGQGMTDAQIRDEVLTLLLAGHETTALTLTYSLHLLGLHPNVDADLLDDLGAAQPDGLVDRVVNESMRLYPPAAILARQALGPDTLGDWNIDARALVVISPWVMHREPRWFDEPTAFKPDRWSKDFARALPRFAYFPFGGGPRVCIGQGFAKMEAAVVLSALLRRFRFEPTRSHLPIQPAVTLRPTEPVRMTLVQRQ